MRKHKKIFTIILPILLVVLLVVGVVSVTYAYFQASANNNDIQGGTATATELELKVAKISTSATGNLIPLDNDVESLTTAAKGYNFSGTTYDETKSCIDKNGYSVCQIYEITIKNNSTAAVVLNGGITSLEGEKTPNIACAVMNNSTSVTNNATCISSTSIANKEKINANDEKKYYMIVYINNLHTEQYDTGTFSGTVSFTSTNGGVTAGFN